MSAALQALSLREQLVVFYRFFRDMTQAEVARLLNVSPMAISRLQASSLNKMRSYLAGPALAG
ncbi:MAG: sigma factor-like helix-turn-helix DNA-binding protein [Candidatus Xenobia bacterium]